MGIPTYDGYAVALAEASDGVTVTCRDLPNFVTCGETRDAALAASVDGLLTALTAHMEYNRTPPPVPARPQAGEVWVPLPGLTVAKLSLRAAMLDQRITQAVLAERLGIDGRNVRRLLDLHHASKWEQIEAAAAALGLRFRLVVEAA